LAAPTFYDPLIKGHTKSIGHKAYLIKNSNLPSGRVNRLKYSTQAEARPPILQWYIFSSSSFECSLFHNFNKISNQTSFLLPNLKK
jgi:hypothetical protein